MVGMILDVFPSYKDKDMVDLLYQFERATGSSLNILVEKYLEKLLYKEGYLTMEMGIEDTVSSENSISQPQDEFRKTKYGSNGRVKIWYGKLCFGSTTEENYSSIIEKLMQFSPEQLHEISNNNWDKTNGDYMRFLKWKLNNPNRFLEDYLKEARFSIRDSSEKWQIRHEGFSLCSGKESNKKEFEKIKKYLFNLSNGELDLLKGELTNCKHRRAYILDKIDRE